MTKRTTEDTNDVDERLVDAQARIEALEAAAADAEARRGDRAGRADRRPGGALGPRDAARRGHVGAGSSRRRARAHSLGE